MNIYRHELRQLRSSLFAWAIALSLISLLFLSLYPEFSRDITASRAVLEHFPPAIRNAFGLSLSAFFTFLGFYAYTFTYVTLAGAVQAMNLGLGVMVREDQAKTTDFLLTKPITRTRVFLAKSAAALTILAATFAVYCAATAILSFVLGAGDFDAGKFMVMNALFFGLELWFLALGIIVSQLARKVRSTIAYTLSFVFGFFIIGVIGALIGDDKVRFVTPFKYVDYLAYVTHGTIDTKYLITGAVFALIMFITGFMLYNKRDKKAAI